MFIYEKRDGRMWLRLNIEGIVLYFRIRGYEPSKEHGWEDQWCSVDLSIEARGYLDYKIEDNVILLSAEVENLVDNLEKLLNGDLNEVEIIEFLEPYFEFILQPDEDSKKSIQYVSMKWVVYFWNDGAPTSNYLSIELCREEIDYLYHYLKLVTGNISKENSVIHKMIQDGIL